MRKTPRALLVLHADRTFGERLRKLAARLGYEITFTSGWDELLDQVKQPPASALVVVDPYWDMVGAATLSPELSALLHRFSWVTVLAAMEVAPGYCESVLRLGEWGIAGVIDLDRSDMRMLEGQLTKVNSRSLRALLMRTCHRRTSGSARSILDRAVTVVMEGGAGKELARALYVTPRTLLRYCRRAGLPAPRPLLAWLRLLAASAMLEEGTRTLADVALACGYSTDASLRQAIRTFLGVTPTALREQGGFERTMQAFFASLAEARAGDKVYRRSRDGVKGEIGLISPGRVRDAKEA